MSEIKDKDLAAFMKGVIRRNPGEVEFHQAVQEVAMDIIPYIRNNKRIKKMQILERMTELVKYIGPNTCVPMGDLV